MSSSTLPQVPPSLRARPKSTRTIPIPSPRETLLPFLSESELHQLAYPPDIMPGARDVSTPHGIMRVNEWGPENGRRVLFIHGDATPSPLWLRIAWGLAHRRCRVMTFDLWGRGYTDSPFPTPHTPALFKAQVLYAITSSSVPWTGQQQPNASSSHPAGISLVGYSLGGAIAVDFASDFPHLVSSVVALAPGGLIHTLPDDYLTMVTSETDLEPTDPAMRSLAARVLEVADHGVTPRKTAARVERGRREEEDKGDWKGWEPRVGVREGVEGRFLAKLLQWQFDFHDGHVQSFYSTARYGSGTADLRESWARTCGLIEGREVEGLEMVSVPNLLRGGKLLVVLGKEDEIIKADEVSGDVRGMIAEDKVEFMFMEGGHSFLWENSEKIVEKLGEWWGLAR